MGHALNDLEIGILQAPNVEGIGEEALLAWQAESVEVVAARNAYAALRRSLLSLRAEVPGPP